MTVATVSRSLALQSPEAWRTLEERGYDLTFAAARDAWTGPLLARYTGSVFVEIPAERRLRPRTLLDLAGRLRRLSTQRWDLVQVQSPIISVLWRTVATGRARRRTIYVVHGFHFQPGERGLRGRAARLIEAALAHRTQALATVSAADHRFVTSLPRLLRPPVVVALPGAGVPVEHYRGGTPPPADAPTSPYALFVGDLNANKDPLCAVAAVEECRARGRLLDLVVIGEGTLAADLSRAAGSRPWLRLVERSDEVPLWMAHAAVLLAPSYREGVPRVVIEALASGTPVVARRNRGTAELLADGLGQVLTTGDSGAWADAVERAVAAPPDTAAMWARASAYGVEPFRRAYAALVSQVEPHGS
ncbi:glycosyltransferase [Ornithinimicrobium pekingense]|uniref:glycosyltransferase n=1 Tax=Ornithinimicrobium pekingense TaxID=384677 RepID=UPI0012EC8FF7|nr:glycosyltransferase [Ornithinimicrobium pekingense]